MTCARPLLLAALLSLCGASCAPDLPTSSIPEAADDNASLMQSAESELVILSRNMYLGASFDPLIAETDPFLVPIRGWQTWQTVLATRAPERIRAMAGEIAALRPDVVGLQEVVLWRTQLQADHYPGGANTPATDVAFDFLAELLDSLRALGADYEVAVVVSNLDAEMIIVPPPGAEGAIMDIRFTDRDAILVRRGVQYRNPQGAQYDARQQLAIGGTPLAVPRGWTSVEVRHRDAWVRIANTHLEIEPFAATQEAQGTELRALLSDVAVPTIVVGDLNSRADHTGTETYRAFLNAGFTDGWSRKHAGFTCCQVELLDNPVSIVDQRIDFVLTRGPLEIVDTYLVGFGRGDGTIGGLWPSDHAGVVARITGTR